VIDRLLTKGAMAHTQNRAQRGGSKIGCMVNLILVGILAAIGIKVFLVYYSNNQLADAAGDIASRATNLDQNTIRAQILDKAGEYKITQALAPGAVTVSRVTSKDGGMCTVKISYEREINMYGLATIKISTNKEIAKPFLTSVL